MDLIFIFFSVKGSFPGIEKFIRAALSLAVRKWPQAETATG
jgi:hypothetical protein